MRFSTLIALVGLTQAIRLNQQGGQGGNGQAQGPEGGDQERPTANNSGPAEQEDRELPSAEEIFNHCERSDDNDDLLTVGEAVACARQHVASQAAERVERQQNRVEEEIRENWPQDAAGNDAALDLAAFENLYDQHVEEVEARMEERSNRRAERRA